jgi:flagella basal body P-ring formation protein FlgA
MFRTVLLGMMLFLTVFSAFADDAILIDTECVMLEDIFPGIGIKDEVACGLDYGEEKTINRQMSMYIINKYNIVGARPGEVTFRRRGVELTEERFQKDIADLLSVMYGKIDVEIDRIRMGRPFYYSEADGYNIDLPRNRFGNVSVSVDNGIRKYNYTVTLTAFGDVYVAGSSIKKGQDIEGLVHKERFELGRIHGDPVKDVKGYIAIRNISAGRPITTGDVIQKPDAFAGSTVQIVYNSGGLNVSTSGELEEDAYIGKNVRVKNATSGKIVRGTYAEGRKVFVNAQ